MLLYALSGLCCGIAAIMLTVAGQLAPRRPWPTSTNSTRSPRRSSAARCSAAAGAPSSAPLLGVIIFSTITNLFAINNLPIEVQNMVKGGIIVAAVLVQQFRFKSVTQFFARNKVTHDLRHRNPPGDAAPGRSPDPTHPHTPTHSEKPGGRHDPASARPVAPPAAVRRGRARRRCPAHRLHQQRGGGAGRPDQGRRRLGRRQRGARQDGHHRLLRPGRRPRLDRRHHQQRQGAGRRSTPT